MISKPQEELKVVLDTFEEMISKKKLLDSTKILKLKAKERKYKSNEKSVDINSAFISTKSINKEKSKSITFKPLKLLSKTPIYGAENRPDDYNSDNDESHLVEDSVHISPRDKASKSASKHNLQSNSQLDLTELEEKKKSLHKKIQETDEEEECQRQLELKKKKDIKSIIESRERREERIAILEKFKKQNQYNSESSSDDKMVSKKTSKSKSSLKHSKKKFTSGNSTESESDYLRIKHKKVETKEPKKKKLPKRYANSDSEDSQNIDVTNKERHRKSKHRKHMETSARVSDNSADDMDDKPTKRMKKERRADIDRKPADRKESKVSSSQRKHERKRTHSKDSHSVINDKSSNESKRSKHSDRSRKDISPVEVSNRWEQDGSEDNAFNPEEEKVQDNLMEQAVDNNNQSTTPPPEINVSKDINNMTAKLVLL